MSLLMGGILDGFTIRNPVLSTSTHCVCPQLRSYWVELSFCLHFISAS